MDADDTLEQLQGVLVPGAAALSRTAEILIRYAQDQKVRRAMETARVTEELQRRSEAHAQAADGYYQTVAAPDWVRTADVDDVALAWKGAQQWRELDPDRFTAPAQKLTGLIRDAYDVAPQAGDLDAAAAQMGVAIAAARQVDDRDVPDSAAEAGQGLDVERDYDTAERRAATTVQLEEAGVPGQAREAKMTADHLNGQHPRSAATATAKGRSRAKRGRESEPTRDRGQGVGR